ADSPGVFRYYRRKVPPGTAVALEDTEALELHERLFPELIRECYHVTAACVHAMIDRARLFTSTDLHDEKMRSLGVLAAGLAHELNNPSSAIGRSAAALRTHLSEAERAARDLGGAGLDAARLAAVDGLAVPATGASRPALTPLEQSDREEAIADWLTDHDVDAAAAQALARL